MPRIGRPRKEPLRAFTPAERTALETVASYRTERADRVLRARLLLTIAEGESYSATAAKHGYRRLAVSKLVRRFNRDGMLAVTGKVAPGATIKYGLPEKERILKEFARSPDREKDGTSVWSLTTLQKALQKAPDGLPNVSTFVILSTLHGAGYSWQKDRTWCHTGVVERKRKDGVFKVTDPRAVEKRGSSSRRT